MERAGGNKKERKIKVPKQEVARNPIQSANIQNNIRLSIGDKINVVIAFCTLCSVVAVFISLFQAKVARDNAYRPSIMLDFININVSWDTNGYPDWLDTSLGKDTFNTVYNKDEDTYTTNYTYTMQIPENTNITFVNIGVGTAKNIKIIWDEANVERLYNYLKNMDDKYEDFCYIGDGSIVITYDDYNVMSNREKIISLAYLSSNSENIPFSFPPHYSILLSEIVRHPYDNNYNDPPIIFADISFEDLQGVKYLQTFGLLVTNEKRINNQDGSGECSFTLYPVESY